MRDDLINPDDVPAALDEYSHSVSIAAIQSVVRDAKLAADRNWWFVYCAIATVVALLLLINNMHLRGELTYKYDVAWVKMYKNGTWDIDFNDSDRSRELLPATIDSILATWVRRRFSENQHSVRFDYGFSHLFMSQELANHFTSSEGFNAPQRAADVSMCVTCPTVAYDVGPIDHFDSDRSTFGSETGTLYQTNVFATRRLRWAVGLDGKDTEDKRIIRIKWRLLSPREIKFRVNQEGGQEWLRANPIGLEIVDYEELEDSANE